MLLASFFSICFLSFSFCRCRCGCCSCCYCRLSQPRPLLAVKFMFPFCFFSFLVDFLLFSINFSYRSHLTCFYWSGDWLICVCILILTHFHQPEHKHNGKWHFQGEISCCSVSILVMRSLQKLLLSFFFYKNKPIWSSRDSAS